MTCLKHAYKVVGRSNHISRPRIRFSCKMCGERIEIPRQTVLALVCGQAKRLRRSRIRHMPVRMSALGGSVPNHG